MRFTQRLGTVVVATIASLAFGCDGQVTRTERIKTAESRASTLDFEVDGASLIQHASRALVFENQVDARVPISVLRAARLNIRLAGDVDPETLNLARWSGATDERRAISLTPTRSTEGVEFSVQVEPGDYLFELQPSKSGARTIVVHGSCEPSIVGEDHVACGSSDLVSSFVYSSDTDGDGIQHFILHRYADGVLGYFWERNARLEAVSNLSLDEEARTQFDLAEGAIETQTKAEAIASSDFSGAIPRISYRLFDRTRAGYENQRQVLTLSPSEAGGELSYLAGARDAVLLHASMLYETAMIREIPSNPTRSRIVESSQLASYVEAECARSPVLDRIR